jgi:hypothetical protein
MKKSKFSVEEQNEIKRIMHDEHVTRKTAIRHLFPKKAAVAPAKDVKKAAANDKSDAVPTEPKSEAGAARSEGLRLYKLAGRPTKAQFIRVYGKRGHLMTWDQRAEAGVPAGKFQAALAEKQGK